jgi:G3E family GTPase
LVSNGFEQYVSYFLENQLTYADLPFLTKEDLIDMKIPIGPRNRLIKIIESLPEGNSHFEPSPKRTGLRDEVDKFMTELSQFSKRSEPKFRASSREQSLEASFESENSSKVCESILLMLKDISDKQTFMMKAIEENQRAIASLRQQAFRKKRSDC